MKALIASLAVFFAPSAALAQFYQYNPTPAGANWTPPQSNYGNMLQQTRQQQQNYQMQQQINQNTQYRQQQQYKNGFVSY